MSERSPRTLRDWRPPAVFNFAVTVIALLAAIALAVMAWRYYEYTPWTRDGRVRVDTVEVAPEVSGTVVDLPITDNQFVHAGDLLFRIDPGTFRNDVTQAEGRLAAARAQASYLDADAARNAALPDIAASAQQQQDSRGKATHAEGAALDALGALAQAQLNLRRTEIRAAVDGWITDLLLQKGSYARAGQRAVTVVNAQSFWVDGYFEETQLPRIHPGDAARIVLMGAPSQPLSGRVAGIGHAIEVDNARPGVQGLPSVAPVFTWVRLAQRIPVRIALDPLPCGVVLAGGMTASVTVLDRKPAANPPAPHCDDAHGR